MMKYFKLALTLATVSVSSCTAVTIPERLSINDGIFATSPPKSRLTTVPNGSNVSAGLVLSRNTVANVEYLQKSYDRVVNSSSAVDPRLIESGKMVRDPDFVIRWIMNSFHGRFGSIKVYRDIGAVNQDGPDVLIVLDADFRMIDFGNDQVSARINIAFYDAHRSLIGEAVGENSKKFDLWAPRTTETALQWDIDQKKVLVEALKELDERVEGLMAKQITLPLPSGKK